MSLLHHHPIEECTPMCTFRPVKHHGVDHYQCSVSHKIHVCNSQDCTYLVQLDQTLPPPHTHLVYYCPLTHQRYYIDPVLHPENNNSMDDDDEEMKLIEAFLSPSSTTTESDPKKKKKKIRIKRGPKGKGRGSASSASSLMDHTWTEDEKNEQLVKLQKQVPSMVHYILDRCQILHLLPEDDLFNINLMCTDIFRRIYTSDYYWQLNQQLARKNYTPFYHVLMMLYNMKKKNGCIVPISADYLNETMCKKVILHHPFFAEHLPDENQMKKLLSHTTILQTTTRSSIPLSSSSSTSSSNKKVDQLSINNNLFTSAREFFCLCVTNAVQSNPDSWPFTIPMDQI